VILFILAGPRALDALAVGMIPQTVEVGVEVLLVLPMAVADIDLAQVVVGVRVRLVRRRRQLQSLVWQVWQRMRLLSDETGGKLRGSDNVCNAFVDVLQLLT
jgi:hypothetical protein